MQPVSEENADEFLETSEDVLSKKAEIAELFNDAQFAGDMLPQ